MAEYKLTRQAFRHTKYKATDEARQSGQDERDGYDCQHDENNSQQNGHGRNPFLGSAHVSEKSGQWLD